MAVVSPFMRRALALARRGTGSASPNPLVGAVVVDADGHIVGEGYHRRAGEDHAEAAALKAAKNRARGASLYVTLEPCNHTGRTPPCTEAIVRAGIRSVIVAMRDPNPRVTGGGVEYLRAHGVEVTVGDGAEPAHRLNRPFVTWSRWHRPYVLLKAAMSLDGKVATKTGASRYLTRTQALNYVHRLRREFDAILVGVNTVLTDNPALTYRGRVRGRDPVRVILDSRGRTPPTAALFHTGSDAPTLVFATDAAPAEWERDIFTAGGEVIRVPSGADGRPELPAVLADLADRDILSILVEGGPTVHAAFIEQRLAHSWLGFIAPLIIGGQAPTPVGGAGVGPLADAPGLHLTQVRRLGPDLLVEADFAFTGTDALKGGT